MNSLFMGYPLELLGNVPPVFPHGGDFTCEPQFYPLGPRRGQAPRTERPWRHVGGFAAAPEASAGCSPFPPMEFPSLPCPSPSLALLLSAQTPLWGAVL